MGDYHSAAVLLVSLLSAILVNHVECFSSGAPLEACGTLSPLPAGHGAQPQTTPVPYELDLSSLLDENGDFSYVPGETYTCTYLCRSSYNTESGNYVYHFIRSPSTA